MAEALLRAGECKPAAAASKDTHLKVRVESAEAIGRTYGSASAALSRVVPGLGAQRRALRTKTFDVAPGKPPALESLTLRWAHLARATREEVMQYFINTWELTDTLFSGLRDDSVFYMVPDKLRRPLIFYFCHPAALYINKMHQAGLVDHVHPFFQKLFETGVDEMSWDDMDVMQEEDFAWPTISECVDFRNSVRAVVEDLISAMPSPAETPVTMESPYWALFMGFEHERIHLETSSVLFRQLPVDAVREPAGWRNAPTRAPAAADAPANALVRVDAGIAVLGKPLDFPSFGWDNEYGLREVAVPAFSAARFLVSNAEFLPFVLAGGYEQRGWWVAPSGDDEGWRWRTYRNATHPSFWVASAHAEMARFVGGRPDHAYQKDDGHADAGDAPTFALRAQFRIIAMPWDWPVEVNYHEAAAFLRWKEAQEGGGAVFRLPTEAEYHLCRADPSPFAAAVNAGTPAATKAAAAGGDPDPASAAVAGGTMVCRGGGGAGGAGADGGVALPAGTADEAAARRAPGAFDAAAAVDVIMQPTAPGNVNFRWHSPTPVDWYGASPAGFHDTHGSVWEWAEDHFAPLPGFELHYLYDDFSAPCFDGWHTVILGSSWVSTGDLASSFARYHFRRHFFQHLGFRYVRLERADAAGEPFPGAATVANLWEGMSTVSNDLTNAFARPAERVPFALEALSPEAALAYETRLAQLAARTFLAATLSVADAPDAATARSALAAARVLHVGCGVGGGSMELARAGFGSVVALDKREPAIRHARVMQHHAQFEYERVTEGVLTATALARIAAGVDRARVRYVVGDIASVPAESLGEAATCGGFDLVVIDDVLTSMTQPLDLVRALARLVRPGGVLVHASANDWDPRVTPRNSWLGGFKMNGEPMSTLHMLRHHLRRAFDFRDVFDLPRLTRAHDRRYALDVLETSVWRRAA